MDTKNAIKKHREALLYRFMGPDLVLRDKKVHLSDSAMSSKHKLNCSTGDSTIHSEKFHVGHAVFDGRSLTPSAKHRAFESHRLDDLCPFEPVEAHRFSSSLDHAQHYQQYSILPTFVNYPHSFHKSSPGLLGFQEDLHPYPWLPEICSEKRFILPKLSQGLAHEGCFGRSRKSGVKTPIVCPEDVYETLEAISSTCDTSGGESGTETGSDSGQGSNRVEDEESEDEQEKYWIDFWTNSFLPQQQANTAVEDECKKLFWGHSYYYNTSEYQDHSQVVQPLPSELHHYESPMVFLGPTVYVPPDSPARHQRINKRHCSNCRSENSFKQNHNKIGWQRGKYGKGKRRADKRVPPVPSKLCLGDFIPADPCPNAEDTRKKDKKGKQNGLDGRKPISRKSKGKFSSKNHYNGPQFPVPVIPIPPPTYCYLSISKDAEEEAGSHFPMRKDRHQSATKQDSFSSDCSSEQPWTGNIVQKHPHSWHQERPKVGKGKKGSLSKTKSSTSHGSGKEGALTPKLITINIPPNCHIIPDERSLHLSTSLSSNFSYYSSLSCSTPPTHSNPATSEELETNSSEDPSDESASVFSLDLEELPERVDLADPDSLEPSSLDHHSATKSFRRSAASSLSTSSDDNENASLKSALTVIESTALSNSFGRGDCSPFLRGQKYQCSSSHKNLFIGYDQPSSNFMRPIASLKQSGLSYAYTKNPSHYTVNTTPLPPRPWIQLAHDPESPSVLKVSVMCYNVLSDKYATQALYSYCPTWALDWEYRKMKISEEINKWDADVITLQEVETGEFSRFFEPFLSEKGYEGIFSPKSRAKTMSEEDRKFVDGCAIFWKSAKFQLEKEHLIEFTQLAIEKGEGSERMLNRVMTRDNIALAAVLRIKDSAYGFPLDSNEESVVGEPFVVCTAHIHWDPEFCDVKLIQCMMLVQKLKDILKQTGQNWFPEPVSAKDIPFLVCGDLNSLPDSGVFEFLCNGRVASTHEDFKDFRDEPCVSKLSACPPEANAYVHDLLMDSAYHPDMLPFTNYTFDFKGMIDYVFSSSSNLTRLGVLGPLDLDWFKNNKILGCPHPQLPSDHIPLFVRYALPPKSQRPLTREAHHHHGQPADSVAYGAGGGFPSSLSHHQRIRGAAGTPPITSSHHHMGSVFTSTAAAPSSLHSVANSRQALGHFPPIPPPLHTGIASSGFSGMQNL